MTTRFVQQRSVAFRRYVVEQTLNGSADLIKERTIGAEVFEREPSCDTNLDHVMRTAAMELRKRLAIYYGEEKHKSALRISLNPGSSILRFTFPTAAQAVTAEPEIAADSETILNHIEGRVYAPGFEAVSFLTLAGTVDRVSLWK